MTPYNVFFTPRGQVQFDDLLARATAAGKRPAFLWWWSEVGRALSDPRRALRVGRSSGQTAHPGGYWLDWLCE